MFIRNDTSGFLTLLTVAAQAESGYYYHDFDEAIAVNLLILVMSLAE